MSGEGSCPPSPNSCHQVICQNRTAARPAEIAAEAMLPSTRLKTQLAAFSQAKIGCSAFMMRPNM